VAPDGCIDFVFDFNGELAPERGASRPHAVVTGAMMASLLFSLPASPRMLGVRFRPGGASAFLGVPASDFTGASTALDDVLPNFASRVLSFAGESDDPRFWSAALERLLLERTPRRAPDELTAYAVRRLASTDRDGRVERVASDMGVVQKRLERILKRETGLTPKEMSRTLRFLSVLRALRSSIAVPPLLSRLALDFGYADQAHFNREFKALAGVSPGAWLAESRSVEFIQYDPCAFL
jgi:AraC-like DNA-binding protein